MLKLAALMVALAAQAAVGQSARPVVVVMETALGDITMAIDVEHAPITATNFLKYVDAGFYDGGRFIRSVRPDNTVRHDVEIQVVQLVGSPSRNADQLPPIPLERTNATGLRHVDGAISMARSGPDTATSSIFIVIGEQASLDFGGARNADGQGFAAFGRVTAGMDVVRKIHASKTGSTGPFETESLEPPIGIVRAYRR